VPLGRRDRLMSAVGPDASGSNPGFACSHMPDKTGMDSALSLWREVAVTKAAASVMTEGRFRECKSIVILLWPLHLRSAGPFRVKC
jgi:hypothetical protein